MFGRFMDLASLRRPPKPQQAWVDQSNSLYELLKGGAE